MNDNIDQAALDKLREPFPPEQIGKLPKHGVTLDFVGHGYLTARFLDADPTWNWRPMAYDERGLPLFDENGGLWMYLTVGGVERIGYGDAAGKTGANAVKEAIGDALRNGGMRFGAALDLWCKGDPDAPAPKRETPADVARADLLAVLRGAGLSPAEYAKRFKDDHGVAIGAADADTVKAFTKLIEDEIAAEDAKAGVEDQDELPLAGVGE